MWAIQSVSFAQSVSCEDLMRYVQQEGYNKGTVNTVQLISSSWLSEVKCYSIDNTLVVIAEIKRDQWGINKKKYVFCGVPSTKWDAFCFGYYDSGKTYGERFNKYIIDYQCNCY